MTQEYENHNGEHLITSWSEAVRLYTELNLDQAVTAYVDFVREGGEQGFPVINLRGRYDYDEQLWYAMSYLLERSLNTRWFRNIGLANYSRYDVNLSCPSKEEMILIDDSLLSTRARALLRYTSATLKYAEKDNILSPEDTDHDRERKDAFKRIEKIKGYYVRRSVPKGQLLICLVVLAAIIFFLLPESYKTIHTYGIMQIAVFGILLISELREHVLLERELHKQHVIYLENNKMIKDLFCKEKKSHFVLKVTDLHKAEASLIAMP